MSSAADSVAMGPLTVLRMEREALLRLVLDAVEGRRPPAAVAFCNSHTAEIAFRDAAFARALAGFTVVNDGIGMEIGARLLEGRGFPANLNGTDFTPFLFGRLERPTRVYLLGAKPGVAAEAGRKFAERFPNFALAGARDGYFAPADEAAVVAEIAASRPDILLVALGNPKQEQFIARHMPALGARALFGVGALLDFTAGRVVRAPAWVRKARFEWAFRLAQEPGRLVRRYTIETAGFLLAVLKIRAAKRAR